MSVDHAIDHPELQKMFKCITCEASQLAGRAALRHLFDEQYGVKLGQHNVGTDDVLTTRLNSDMLHFIFGIASR
jgi:hypothetical protein